MKQTLLLILALSLLLACTPPQNPVVSLQGNTMGGTYSVKYVTVNSESTELSADQIQSKIDSLLVDINQLMSTYISDSELSILNKTKANISFTLSEQTHYVLQEAIRLHDLSDGALDVTIGPVVNLWGFGPTHRPDIVPSDSQLLDTQAYVGVDKFTLDGLIINKSHESVYIDLSTIAKGYAVDAVADLLTEHGLDNYLVEIGGEMRVSGTKPHNIDWMIAIEKPVSGTRIAQKIITIGDNAIATSGDYRNYFEEDGVRYSHLIDPKTLKPIQHNLVSVSVVAKKSIEADGLATALIVLGAERGIELAEKHNIAAFFITKEADGTYTEYMTSAFKNQVEIKN